MSRWLPVLECIACISHKVRSDIEVVRSCCDAETDDGNAAAMLEDEEEEAREAPTAGGVPPIEQRALRGTASGRDAAGQPDTGLGRARDGGAAESADAEAESETVRMTATRTFASRSTRLRCAIP